MKPKYGGNYAEKLSKGMLDYINDVDTDLSNIIRAINAGFRPVRMTTSQRNSLTNTFPGLIIYNVTTNKLNVYTTTWETITST